MHAVADDLDAEAASVLFQMAQLQATTYVLPSASSLPVGRLSKCDVVEGIPLGDGWIELTDRVGFSPGFVEGVEVLTRLRFEKRREIGGSCEDVGLHPIDCPKICAAAGDAVGLWDWTSQTQDGCVAVSLEHPGQLQELCSNVRPCVATTTTATTGTTSTSYTFTAEASETDVLPTNKTAGNHPSLFCFDVLQNKGYELELVIDQFRRTSSIFACDAHLVISDANRTLPTPDGRAVSMLGVGSIESKMGKWGSWANALVFQKAWRAVIADGRFQQYDWIVKVDADCVFRPDALKWHLGESEGNQPIRGRYFLHNWVDSYPVVGAIEIASSDAVAAMPGARCDDMGTDSAEDDWFVQCMKRVDASVKRDGALLQHGGTPSGDKCGDPWWVAIHPFKDVDSFRRCEDKASA